MPNFAFIDGIKCNLNKQNPILKRDFSNFDKEKFLNFILNDHFSISKLKASDDVNTKYNIFHDLFLNALDKYAPIKKISKNEEKRRQKPWITTGIRKSISTKNKFYKYFMKTKDQKYYLKYKMYRDKINHLIRKSKINHYSNYFGLFKNNSKNNLAR